MKALGTTRAARAQQEYVELRLDKLQNLGAGFTNPVQFIKALNGPANIGATLQFQVYQSQGVDTIAVLRGVARDPASAAILQSYRGANLPVKQPVSYYDTDTSIIGKKVFYWLKITPLNQALPPILQGPVILTVPSTGTTLLTALNDSSFTNTTNFATVDSVDIGGGAGTTVRIYGTGGVGSSWTRKTGYGATLTFAGGQITPLLYTTQYRVYWDSVGLQYVAFTTVPPTLPDQYVWAGLVTTVASGGGGGTGGGGGSGGGSGGRQLQ